MDETLLSRVEDAGINASAPAQQRWLDGWLLRFCPGKAKRARCINAMAPGRLPLDHKLRLAAAVFRDAGLPMVVRITPFSQPDDLDAQLATRGFTVLDDTRVMVCHPLTARPLPSRMLVPGAAFAELDGPAMAIAVGALRGSSPEQCRAHGARLASSPAPYRALAIRSTSDGSVLACAQSARDGTLVGLYDVFTREDQRGQGLASQLCERLLSDEALAGAGTAYLQVEADNHGARRIYRRLGFADAYAYHYRVAPDAPQP